MALVALAELVLAVLQANPTVVNSCERARQIRSKRAI